MLISMVPVNVSIVDDALLCKALPLVCMLVFLGVVFMILKKKRKLPNIQLLVIIILLLIPVLTFTIIFLGVPPYPLFDPVLALGAPARGRPPLNL